MKINWRKIKDTIIVVGVILLIAAAIGILVPMLKHDWKQQEQKLAEELAKNPWMDIGRGVYVRSVHLIPVDTVLLDAKGKPVPVKVETECIVMVSANDLQFDCDW